MREPVATRSLAWDDGITQREVLVRVWGPVPDDASFVCDFAIDGLPEPVRSTAMGADALQALILALTGIRTYLDLHETSIAWLGERGEHGIPMQIWCYDYRERRRLESVVASEIELFSKRSMESFEREQAELAATFDSDRRVVTSGDWSTADLVNEFTAASAHMREARMRGDEEARHFFFIKRLDIVAVLRAKSDYKQALKVLVDSDERSARLLAAQLLDPSERTRIVRIRDEGIEPEASEAASFLENIERRERRPKSWDTD